MLKYLPYFLLFLTLVNAENLSPIIGIFAEYNEDFTKTYIASSYVKFAEMGGARVIPIRSDLGYSELKDLFNKINGFIIPGGDAPLVINK